MKGKRQIRIVQSGKKNDNLIFLKQKRNGYFKKEKLSIQSVNASVLEKQLKHFQKGFPYTKLIKPAKVSEGIIRLNAKKKKELLFLYEQRGKAKKKVKFVPASGAATRMFKGLFKYLAAVNAKVIERMRPIILLRKQTIFLIICHNFLSMKC